MEYGKTPNKDMDEHGQMWDLEPIRVSRIAETPKRTRGLVHKLLWLIIAFLISVMIFFLIKYQIKQFHISRLQDPHYVEQEVTKYLEDRYGEEFVVVYNRGMGPAYNYVQLFAYPQGYSDSKHKFEVQGYYNDKGELDYYDSYVMVKLTDEYEAYIDPIIDEYFDEYKFYVRFDSEWLTNNLPPDTKVEDLWEMRANQDYPLPTLYLYLSPIQKVETNLVKNMCLDLRNTGLRGRVKIWKLEDGDKYKKLYRNRCNNKIKIFSKRIYEI